MSNADDFKDKILIAIHEKVTVNTVDLAALKVDVKEHIKRTNLLQAKVEAHDRYIYMFHGAAFVVGCIFAVLKYIVKVI